MGTREFVRVSCDTVGCNQNSGFGAAVSQDVDEVADRLAVYRPVPIFALDDHYSGQQYEPIRRCRVTYSNVNLFRAKEAG